MTTMASARHTKVLSSDGTTAWCSTCEDPTTGQTYEPWPCRVRRLESVLLEAGVPAIPLDVLEHAAATVTSGHQRALQSALAYVSEGEEYPGQGSARDLALHGAPGVVAARGHAHRSLNHVSSRQYADAVRDIELAALDVLAGRGTGARLGVLVDVLERHTSLMGHELTRALLTAARGSGSRIEIVDTADGRIVRARRTS